MRTLFTTAIYGTVAALVGACGMSAAQASTPGQNSAAAAAVAGLVRVDQVGYLPGDLKRAYLMAPGKVAHAGFRVLDGHGHTVFTGKVGASSLGSWNKAYPDVYPITFSALHTKGTYHVVLTGGARGTSPSFTVGDADTLYHPLVADGVAFYQVQRDGANVVSSVLHRKPSHLDDAHATVYAAPHFASEDDDTITDATLTAIGGPVDVEGGWFDAGDYLKFTHTTAYGDALLYASQRALGAHAPASLATEAQFGEQWLNQMWDQSTKTLYVQVGIGTGNETGTFFGDHDLWRLPQADDKDTAKIDKYAAAHRPVFEAAKPGTKISPNLAGRVSAAFALAAQVDAAKHPARAAAEYRAATSLYAMANTAQPPATLVTALPHSYYPESTWRDDMEFGAAEIALAAQRLGHNAKPYIADGARFAAGYMAHDTGDTFNLYDTSALAHADLITAMRRAHSHGLAVTTTQLIADLKRQLAAGAAHAQADIFAAGANYDDFDADSHTFGLVATAALYQSVSGDRSFNAFATAQRDWVFGANAWGTSFMVGAGDTSPTCMQQQVSNLNRTPALGAVVNGPNDQGQFEGGLGGFQDGMVKCPGSGDAFKAFTGHGSRYVDDVRSWQTSEPALDMTGSAIFALAVQEATGDHR